MGLTPARARSCVRFSFSHYNTDADIDYALEIIPPMIEELRAMSPLNAEHPDNFDYDVEAAREKEEKLMAADHGRDQRVGFLGLSCRARHASCHLAATERTASVVCNRAKRISRFVRGHFASLHRGKCPFSA